MSGVMAIDNKDRFRDVWSEVNEAGQVKQNATTVLSYFHKNETLVQTLVECFENFIQRFSQQN